MNPWRHIKAYRKKRGDEDAVTKHEKDYITSEDSSDGSKRGIHVAEVGDNAITVRFLLEELLEEQKKTNQYLSMITEENLDDC